MGSPAAKYAPNYVESDESEERRPIDPSKYLPITLTDRQAALLE